MILNVKKDYSFQTLISNNIERYHALKGEVSYCVKWAGALISGYG